MAPSPTPWRRCPCSPSRSWRGQDVRSVSTLRPTRPIAPLPLQMTHRGTRLQWAIARHLLAPSRHDRVDAWTARTQPCRTKRPLTAGSSPSRATLRPIIHAATWASSAPLSGPVSARLGWPNGASAAARTMPSGLRRRSAHLDPWRPGVASTWRRRSWTCLNAARCPAKVDVTRDWSSARSRPPRPAHATRGASIGTTSPSE